MNDLGILALPTWCAMPIALIGVGLVLAFACRVRLLSPTRHRVSVWLLHWSGLVCCGWITLAALIGAPLHALDAAVLLWGAAHIGGTVSTWWHGTPLHALLARYRHQAEQTNSAAAAAQSGDAA